jgi:hypothetical protein
VAAAVVLPHVVVQAVVEVEIFHVLEFALGRGKHLLAQLDVVVHRAADVEKQQHLDLVVMRGRGAFLLYRRKFQSSVDAVKPPFDAIDTGMYDSVIQMQLCHLRFNGRYPLFNRAEVILNLSDIGPDRPQVLKDQIFNILSHGLDSELCCGEDSSVFFESKAKESRLTTKRGASSVASSRPSK